MAECDDDLDCSMPTQTIRVVDVFLLGPAMVYVGVKQRGALGAFVALAGISTIVFNGDRLVRAAKLRASEE